MAANQTVQIELLDKQSGAYIEDVDPLTTPIAVIFPDGENLQQKLDAIGSGEPGPPGPAGQSATVTLGTVTTGNAGTNVVITNTGTASAAIFNFTIPRGNTGANGSTGAQGPVGPAGTSAYQAAVNGGYSGTEANFNSNLNTMASNPALRLNNGVLQYQSGSSWINVKAAWG